MASFFSPRDQTRSRASERSAKMSSLYTNISSSSFSKRSLTSDLKMFDRHLNRLLEKNEKNVEEAVAGNSVNNGNSGNKNNARNSIISTKSVDFNQSYEKDKKLMKSYRKEIQIQPKVPTGASSSEQEWRRLFLTKALLKRACELTKKRKRPSNKIFEYSPESPSPQPYDVPYDTQLVPNPEYPDDKGDTILNYFEKETPDSGQKSSQNQKESTTSSTENQDIITDNLITNYTNGNSINYHNNNNSNNINNNNNIDNDNKKENSNKNNNNNNDNNNNTDYNKKNNNDSKNEGKYGEKVKKINASNDQYVLETPNKSENLLAATENVGKATEEVEENLQKDDTRCISQDIDFSAKKQEEMRHSLIYLADLVVPDENTETNLSPCTVKKRMEPIVSLGLEENVTEDLKPSNIVKIVDIIEEIVDLSPEVCKENLVRIVQRENMEKDSKVKESNHAEMMISTDGSHVMIEVDNAPGVSDDNKSKATKQHTMPLQVSHLVAMIINKLNPGMSIYQTVLKIILALIRKYR